jgi:hypothetical protein
MMRSPAYTTSTAWRTVLAIGAVLIVAAPGAESASAQPVKRLCKPRIEWSTAETRAKAQRQAIDGWASAVASQHGEAFTKWAIAGIARASCELTPEGHRCHAAGSPCRDLNAGEGAAPAQKR